LKNNERGNRKKIDEKIVDGTEGDTEEVSEGNTEEVSEGDIEEELEEKNGNNLLIQFSGMLENYSKIVPTVFSIFIRLSAFTVLLLEIVLFLILLTSLFIITKSFYYIIINLYNSNTNFELFVINFAPLIELSLFFCLLILLMAGLYYAIGFPIATKGRIQISIMSKIISYYLGLTFLTIICSILSVTALITIISIHLNLENLTQTNLFNNAIFILCIVFTIMGLTYLIKTEYSLQKKDSQEKDKQEKD